MYYDKEFKPYKIVDGQCVVADESEWQKLFELDKCTTCKTFDDCEANGGDCPKSPRPIVKVPTDIFEDVEGGVFDSEFRHLFDLESEAIRPRDLLTRFFQAVDSTPQVDYLIVTQRPEVVRELYPIRSCDGYGNSKEGYGFVAFDRPNVILATYVETQADIKRLIPELLKCHDLCKGLAVVCNPKEELDFVSLDDGTAIWDFLEGEYEWKNGKECGHCESLDLIIAEGNEHPIHPQWLRSLRDQCKDVVPFHFAGWGRWEPLNGNGIPDKHDDSPEIEPFIWIGRDGQQSRSGCSPDRVMIEVGKEQSGRLLDGQEHNGRL